MEERKEIIKKDCECEKHSLLKHFVHWRVSQLKVGLAGVQIFGRYESAPGPDDAAFGSRTNPTDIPTNGRFSAEIDELLQRVERNKSKVAMVGFSTNSWEERCCLGVIVYHS